MCLCPCTLFFVCPFSPGILVRNPLLEILLSPRNVKLWCVLSVCSCCDTRKLLFFHLENSLNSTNGQCEVDLSNFTYFSFAITIFETFNIVPFITRSFTKRAQYLPDLFFLLRQPAFFLKRASKRNRNHTSICQYLREISATIIAVQFEQKFFFPRFAGVGGKKKKQPRAVTTNNTKGKISSKQSNGALLRICAASK